jgi:AcrR family transcriptional regulator
VPLAEDPADGVTVAAVAERSGVHAATIYRRWGGVPGLLEDVVEAGPARTAPLPDTGSLRGDVEAYARGVAETLTGPLGVLTLRTAAANVRPAARRRADRPRLTRRADQRCRAVAVLDGLLARLAAGRLPERLHLLLLLHCHGAHPGYDPGWAALR